MVQQAFRVDQVSTSNIEFKSNSFISSIAADATLASNVHLVLPTSVGSSGQVLATDGSGNLSFVSQGVGGPADLVQDNVNSLTSTVDSFGVYANNTFGAGGSNVSVANVTSQEFSIDGSTNTFTLVNTTDNVNKLLVSYGGIAQKPSEYTVSNTDLTLSNTRPLISGTTVEVRYLDFEFSGSVGSGGGGGVISGTSYSSTLYNNTSAGITTFNDVSTPALPTYTVGKIGVYVNGVKLSNNAFSASTGDSVVLDNATLLGDDVEIVNFGMSSASLNDLTDVDITTNTPSNGQALVYVNANSKWEPGTVASSYGNSDVDLHLNQSTASTDQVLSWDGSDYAWVDQSTGGSSGASTPALTDYEFTATANQTSFAATYIPGSVQVFLNGVKLANTEFTATSGTSIVLGSNTASGDTISVSKIGGSSNLTVANASASSTGSISYDSGSEVLMYTPPDLSGYQSTLVSNTNIKTINGNSLLGSGNITISSGGGIAGTMGSLTKSFANNESATITLSSNVSPVPNVSVFKEVPQQGFSSKGQWDVNANATNYEFFDEKPISYSSATLTPSATGDGTFTSSSSIVSGYDFTNFAYDSVTAATGISGNNEAIRFNNNGTKMYILSDGGPDGIYQFSLSTAYDITTASYDSVSFSVTQDSSPRDFQFNSDGSKMFILGSTNRQIYRYSLSTAYDLSTTSYDSVSLSIAYSTSMLHFHFNGDGTKIYVGSSATWTIYERQLPGAYDISSESAVSTFGYNADLPSGSTEAYAYSGIFNDNGKKMYLLIGRMPDTSEAVIEYDLSTAYDLSTISRTSIQTLNPSNAGNDPRGMTWNSDGTKLIILTEPADMFRFTSSTSSAFNAADVGKKVVGNSGSAIITSTAGAYTSVTAFADTSAISSWQLFGAEGKSDGSGIQLSGFQNGYDIANASYDNVSFSLQAQDSASAPQNTYTGPNSLRFNNDGTKMYFVAGNSLDHIFEYDLSTAWDLSSASYNNSNLVVTSQTTSPTGIEFSSDGTKLFLAEQDGDKIWKYNLSTAWDLSSASYSNNQTPGDILRNLDAKPGGLVINSDGTRILWLGKSNERVYQMTLSTAYDLSTASMDTKLNGLDAAYVDISALGTAMTDINISSDGKKLFLVNGYGNTGIYQYDLANPYEINDGSTNSNQGTASYNNISFSFPQDGRPSSVAFDTLGTKMYAVGMDNDTVYQYSTGEAATPYSQYSPALTNSSTGQINSSSWQDINSMTADETKNDGDIFYAVSTDNRTSWGVAKASDGVRKIARNNSGTWQYNNHAGTNNPWQYNSGAASGNTLTISSAFNYGSWLSGGGLHTNASIKFSPDGTKIFWAPAGGNSDGDDIYSANLSTAWDLSTATQGPVYTEYSSSGYGQASFAFNSDGTKLYTVVRTSTSSTSRRIRQWSLSTAYDVSTSSYVGQTAGITSSAARGLYVAPDESYFIAVDLVSGQTYIKKWNLATAGNITSTLTGETAVDVTSYTSWSAPAVGSFYATAPDFFDSGNKMVILNHGNGGSNTNDAYLVELSTAYDITSGTVIGKFTSATGANLYGVGVKPDGSKLYAVNGTGGIVEFNTGAVNYETSETWVNGTNNSEHATLQEALGAQSFNRMDKTQLDAVADAYHFSQDSADTLDLMIAPYAASGTSPISDGVTINYDAEALVKQAINGTDYEAYFPSSNSVSITSLAAQNLKIRII